MGERVRERERAGERESEGMIESEIMIAREERMIAREKGGGWRQFSLGEVERGGRAEYTD